jgi:BNR repeat protein
MPLLPCARRPCAAVALAACVASAVPPLAQAGAVTVVEYYNRTLDHYFMTALAGDIDALDAGRLHGWSRTGRNFIAFGLAPSDFPAGSPVCRYYIPPAHGDSHFFSASPAECAAVAAHVATDPNYSGYILETPAAFFALLPDAMTGTCATGLQPVYRLWNQRADSNHRYVTDLALRSDLLAGGYAAEGYGDLGVAMCVSVAVPGDAITDASSPSPYPAGCDVVPAGATSYVGAEVEPMLAVDPRNAASLVGVWQQDRWSDGGARGLRTGYSSDGGRSWRYGQAAFTRCSGGTSLDGGDYARASDPWVSIGPDGIAYQIAIAFTGNTFAPGSVSAVLASRSLDGGATWSPPATLIRDGASAFNDKESITADPTDDRFVYAVWDRIAPSGAGPTWLARSSDAGATWEPARAIYTPPANAQTINNQVVVRPDGTLVLFFTQLAQSPGQQTATLGVARSLDKGLTWGAPTFIAASLSIGTHDPGSGVGLRDAGNLGAIAVGPDGSLAVAWQDARFSAGTVEGIAFSRSLDGGVSWTVPVQVNRVPSAQALLPAVAIRADGTIGVQYYDLRNAGTATTTLATDVWLVESSDGVNWRETHLDGPFDFRRAPLVSEDGGAFALFVGDYQALGTGQGTSDAAVPAPAFLPFFAQATATSLTDVFAGIVTRPGAAVETTSFKARPSRPDAQELPGLRAAAARNVARTIARRLHVMQPPGVPDERR